MTADTIAVSIVEMNDEAKGIRSYRLQAADGSPLPRFTPGAHVDVLLDNGLVRQYSLCNTVDEDSYVIAVKREPDSSGGSAHIHEHFRPGTALSISPPRNRFPLVDSGQVLLLAGGIGITPLLSMARHIQAQKDDHTRDFRLEYFSSSPEETAFRTLLEGPDNAGRVGLHPGLSPDEVAAVLTQALARDADSHVYICGPEGFMALASELALRNRADDRVHLEYFSAPPRDAEAGSDGDRPFQVTLARRGETFEIPAGRCIVEVLADHGITVPTSCEQGICGTCVTTVLSGRPQHRDLYLLDNEKEKGDVMCLCVSRSLDDRLVLDL